MLSRKKKEREELEQTGQFSNSWIAQKSGISNHLG